MTSEMLEFLDTLKRQGARALIIGGYALAFLGVPRYTKDLDLWVDMEGMKPVARKYRFEEVPSERERWSRLPLEERLKAVVEMSDFWARRQGLTLGRIAPVARKRPLG